MRSAGGALVRGASARLAAMAVTLATGLVLLPILIHGLGDRLYGVWVLVGTVLGYYGLLDLGLSSAVNRFVSRSLGQGDKPAADAYITAGLCLFALAGAATLVISVGGYFLCGLLIADGSEAVLLGRLLLIMGAAFALSLLARAWDGTLMAHMRYDLLSAVAIGVALLRAALMILVLRLGGGILGLAAVSAAVSVARLVGVVFLAWHQHGGVALRREYCTHARIHEMVGYSAYTFLAQVSDLVRFRAWPFIVSGFLGAGAVTFYAIANRVVDAIAQVCSSVSSTLTPLFSRKEGRNDQAAIREAYRLSYKVSCYLGVFLTLLMASAGRDIVARWMGEAYLTILPILYILLAATLLAVIQIPTVNLLYGVSHHKAYALSNSVQGILTVLLSIILVRPLGLIGVAIGVAVPMALVKSLILPYHACQILHMSVAAYHWRYTLPNLLKAGIFGVMLYLGVSLTVRPEYLRLSITALAAGLLYIPYIFYIGFTASERDLLWRSAREAIGHDAVPGIDSR